MEQSGTGVNTSVCLVFYIDRGSTMVMMAESLKVPEDAFKAAIRALLNTPPTPMADIPRKREPKAKQPKKP